MVFFFIVVIGISLEYSEVFMDVVNLGGGKVDFGCRLYNLVRVFVIDFLC